jgi:predicted small lipoprotein YifL
MAGKAGVMKNALTLMAALALLAACGRTGPPRAPGPADQIVYPRAYPTPPKGTTAPTTPVVAAPSVPLAVPPR